MRLISDSGYPLTGSDRRRIARLWRAHKRRVRGVVRARYALESERGPGYFPLPGHAGVVSAKIVLRARSGSVCLDSVATRVCYFDAAKVVRL